MKVPCRQVRYREFPELLFGTSPEGGPAYFDATHFILARGDARRHSVELFRTAFRHWIPAAAEAYGTGSADMFAVDETSGHFLIDECLALLFAVYIDPPFGVYLLERMSEMLTEGFAVSDTWLAHAARLRFSNEELTLKKVNSNEQ